MKRLLLATVTLAALFATSAQAQPGIDPITYDPITNVYLRMLDQRAAAARGTYAALYEAMEKELEACAVRRERDGEPLLDAIKYCGANYPQSQG